MGLHGETWVEDLGSSGGRQRECGEHLGDSHSHMESSTGVKPFEGSSRALVENLVAGRAASRNTQVASSEQGDHSAPEESKVHDRQVSTEEGKVLSSSSSPPPLHAAEAVVYLVRFLVSRPHAHSSLDADQHLADVGCLPFT